MWQKTEVPISCGPSLVKWTTTPSNSFTGFQLEYNLALSTPSFFINTASLPLTSDPQITYLSESESWEEVGLVLEGCQRIKIGEMAGELLYIKLCQEEEITISFGRFCEVITPQGFLVKEKKVLHSTLSEWLQNSCPGI